MPELGHAVHYTVKDTGNSPIECRAALITRTWRGEPDRLNLRIFAHDPPNDWAVKRAPYAAWAAQGSELGTWHEGGHE